MNNENEKIDDLGPERDPDLVPETGEPPVSTDASSVNRKRAYLVGAAILLIVSALLIWIYFGRGEGGKAVPPPRDVSFGENDGDVMPSREQTITLTDEQLKAANLKIETVGETLSVGSAAAATTGVVQPNDYTETPVISLVGGVARQVSVELGQFVRAGQTVAVVHSEELAKTEADYLSKRADSLEAEKRYQRSLKLTGIASESRNEIDEMRAKLRIAEALHLEHLSHFRRTEKLLEIGAVSRESFEMARSQHETALANLDEAKSRFARAEKLLDINPARRAEQDEALRQLQTARAEAAAMKQRLLVLGLPLQRINLLTDANQISSALPIMSPVSGTVTMRKVNPGETVMSNAELLKVTNLSTVWVIGQVYEKDLASIRIGSGASVTSDSYPGEIFRGNISYIDPNLDQNTRTAQVRIELPNSGERLKIGMYVNIGFATLGGSEKTVPSVPKGAVQDLGGRPVVFVATDNPNVFILRPVRLGEESDGRFPVLEGLFVGDRVVTEGSFLLRAEWQKSNPPGS